jgi:oligopeptide/dipeptide ABC transporter ATP-binding protein
MSALLTLSDVSRHFPARGGRLLRAVDGVSLSLSAGETLAIVGESGCGKSTLARLALRLLPVTAGRVVFRGEEISGLSERELRPLRRHMQLIFQNPHAALDPRQTLFDAVAEPLAVQRAASGKALLDRVAAGLESVGLPADFLWRYPHELSGGQKQRACIARAIALKPALLVLDEPTSALDVSVQAQILDLLRDLKRRDGLTFLFISHNLAVVRQMADRVAVMYLGRIVEEGPVADVFAAPRHPYTQALLRSVLPIRAGAPLAVPLGGDIPNAADLPTGCRFRPRCPLAFARCVEDEPQLMEMGAGRHVACHAAAAIPVHAAP